MNLSFLNSGMATDVFERLAECLLHFVWQGAVLAVIVLVADRCLRGCSSQARYAVHVMALLLMLGCVPVTYALLERQPKDETVTAAQIVDKKVAASPVVETTNSDSTGEQIPFAADEHPQVAEVHPPQSLPVEQTWNRLRTIARIAAPYTACAYLLGVALMFGRLALALLGGHRLCSEARPVTDSALLAMVARQARRLGLKAAPVVAWCGRTSAPLVAGLLKPMILLPVAIASSLTPDQLEAILAHELAHVRRFDLLVNFLQRVAEALLFFHPAVWYVSRRISSERENCCDDSVLLAGWGRVQYADALVRMAEVCAKLRGINGLNAATILAAAGNNPSQFKQRIMRLLGEQESLRLGISRSVAIAILAGVLGAVLAIPLLFSAPSLVAQGEKNTPTIPLAKEDQKPTTDAKVPLKPQEKRYFRGKEALERIEDVKPAWSESKNSIEFGIARIGDRSRFYSGERVPLEMFIRNTGKETIKVQLAADFLANVPEVTDDRGEAVKVEGVFATGGVALYRETLKPGEAFGFRHLGLGLGPNPAPGKENWYPYWAEPKPGRYKLRHTHMIDVESVDESNTRKGAMITKGAIEFEVAFATAAKAPGAADPFAAQPAVEADPFAKPIPNDKPPENGLRRRFSSADGHLESEDEYKNGKRHGTSRQFDKFGLLIKEREYKEGVLVVLRDYKRGKLVLEEHYQRGKRNGTAWTKNGNYEFKGEYLNGKLNGKWTVEGPNDWRFIRHFKDGKPDGVWESRKGEEKPLSRVIFKDGKLVGEKGSQLPAFEKVTLAAKDGKDPTAVRALKTLTSSVDLDYPDTPLRELLEDIHERFNCPMYFDPQAHGIEEIYEMPVWLNEKLMPLVDCLSLLATEHGLSFDYRFHALWLTTPEALLARKDTTGISDLKLAPASPLAKAFSETPKFDFFATELQSLPDLLKTQHGLEVDVSQVPEGRWHIRRTNNSSLERKLTLRDALGISLTIFNCRCREEGGKLIIEPVGMPPKEKAEPAKEKGAGLRINVPALGPTPLAFDFAFPVDSKGTDQKQSFCFFFGVLK